MNGVHDMGGMQGFGPIAPPAEDREELFHDDWERRALALTLACGSLGQWTLDKARSSRESLDPALYLNSSYYRIWIEALGRQLVDAGLLTADELATGTVTAPVAPGTYRVLAGKDVNTVMDKGGPTAMPLEVPPRFAVGDRITARNMHPVGHTRLPRYVRGRPGTIAMHHGGHVFADDNAQGQRRAEHLYTVRFTAQDLWGPDHSADDSVMVDLWEPYLDLPA